MNIFTHGKYCFEMGRISEYKRLIEKLPADLPDDKTYKNDLQQLLHVKDINGFTPLTYAVKTMDLNFVELLLEKGADPNFGKGDYDVSDTALMFVSNSLYSAFESEKAMTKLLLKYGADFNVTNENGDTPLILAVKNNKKELVQFYIDCGADVNYFEREIGHTALMVAAKYNHSEMMNLLMKNKAEVNLVIDNKDTALLMAVDSGNFAATKLLLENGADKNGVFLKSDSLMLSLGRMASGNDGFWNYGNYDGYKSIAMYLINSMEDLNKQDVFGETSLIKAVRCRDLELVQALIEKGANLDIQDKGGNTALMFAIHTGQNEMAKKLIEHGARPDLQNRDGIDALMLALNNKQKTLAKIILQNKASLKNVDKYGNTASSLAFKVGFADLFYEIDGAKRLQPMMEKKSVGKELSM